MLTGLYPLPQRVPSCDCGADATYYTGGFLGDAFFCDECAVVKAAESWAAISAAVASAGYRLVRTERGYEVVR